MEPLCPNCEEHPLVLVNVIDAEDEERLILRDRQFCPGCELLQPE